MTSFETVERRPTLSLNEWAALSCLMIEPQHGYDVSLALSPAERLGRVWKVSRPLVYRAFERLEALEYVAPRRDEVSTAGPPRRVYGPTRKGRAIHKAWLRQPVLHIRDVRSELLFKLVILEMLGHPHGDLVDAQIQQFADVFNERGQWSTTGDVVAQWRQQSAAAVETFLRNLQ